MRTYLGHRAGCDCYFCAKLRALDSKLDRAQDAVDRIAREQARVRRRIDERVRP